MPSPERLYLGQVGVEVVRIAAAPRGATQLAISGTLMSPSMPPAVASAVTANDPLDAELHDLGGREA